jgi:hypothetical protein
MQQVSNGVLLRQPNDCANHSGTLVGKTADAEDRSAETVPSQRSPASATSLGQQSAAGTCLTVAPSLNDGALPVDSTSKPSGLEPACIGAPVNADVALNQNERALENRCANCGRLGHASNLDPRCPFHGRERGQIEWAPHHPDSALGDNVPHMSETRICIFANGVKQSSSQRRPFWYPAVVVSSIDLSCFCRASHKSLNKQQIDIEGVPRGSIIQSNIQRRLTKSPRITNM